MALELRKRVVEFLSSNADRSYSAREIARWIKETYPEEAAAKLAASASLETGDQLLAQLVAEIGANRPSWQARHRELRTTEGIRPRRYYWTTKSQADEVAEAEMAAICIDTSEAAPRRLSESDLYPLVTEYLRSELKVRAERIDERKSSNSSGGGGNKWLFPDIVGVENLTHGLNGEVVTAMRESRDRRLRLWSFEVKLLINRSNARETYFQAVSNSSWANFGYLVAAGIEGGDTLPELRILFSVHGVGVIRLDADNPAESEILIPARERSDVEWPMCSRLANENKDFLAFMRRVRQFFQAGDLE